MAKRKSTGKRQRFNIFKRDKFTCQYCGRTPPTIVLVLDHVLPVSKGGETVDHNLITSCEVCNQGKADGLLENVPQSIDANLAGQVERREQLEAYNEFLMEARRRDDTTARLLGTHWCDSLGHEPGKFTFAAKRLQSVKTFLKRLPAAEIYDAIDVAIANMDPEVGRDEKAWKYFCGICWKKITRRDSPEEEESRG